MPPTGKLSSMTDLDIAKPEYARVIKKHRAEILKKWRIA
jgi:hypothetical protein